MFLRCNEHVVVHMIPVSLGGTHQFPPVSDTVCFGKNHGCHWATERRRRNVYTASVLKSSSSKNSGEKLRRFFRFD